MQQPVYLVTGATDGIGKATALALARRGVGLVPHGRDRRKMARTLVELQAAAPGAEPRAVYADFASLDQVAALADTLQRDCPGLSVLINNVGLITDHRQLSADGFELTLAVNYLAPCLLTRRLLGRLRQNAPARIVNVASTAMGSGDLRLDDLQAQRHFDGWQAYANSKLANFLFSMLLAERLAGSGVVCNALCPGLIDTNFFHTSTVFADGAYERLRPRMRPTVEGATVPVHVALAAEAGTLSGRFFVRDGRDDCRAVSVAWDRALAAELWEQTSACLAPWLD